MRNDTLPPRPTRANSCNSSVPRNKRQVLTSAPVTHTSSGVLPSTYSTSRNRAASAVILKKKKNSLNSSPEKPVPKKERPVPKKCYTVGTMKRCGSIFEEMIRQLLATGRWKEVQVRQRPIIKTLYVPELQRDLSDLTVHLMIGEKTCMENLVAHRRQLWARHKARSTLDSTKKPSTEPLPTVRTGHLASARPLRLPMGGEDGSVRIVDFIEGTRCITLKSKMVETLLEHHQGSWERLGKYVPLTFRIDVLGGPRDQRKELIAASLNKSSWRNGKPPLWIAKSSSGAHGDNIEIFKGDKSGIQRLLKFVENQKGNIWVAQQYIDRPLLYHKRKFDIRCFALLIRDSYEIYVHEEIIMRTSSVVYNRDSATSKNPEGRLAHITNHCVQSEGEHYSMYEEGNELWREHLDGLIRYKGGKLLKSGGFKWENKRLIRKSNFITSIPTHAARTQGSEKNSPSLSPSPPRNVPYSPSPPRDSFHDNEPVATPNEKDPIRDEVTVRNYIMPQINYIIKDTLCAARPHLPTEPSVPSPTQCFQIFGYDFLIDEDLKVWLLEINGAPAGADRLVPRIIKDTIEIAITPFFPLTLSKDTNGGPSGYVKVYPLKPLDN